MKRSAVEPGSGSWTRRRWLFGAVAAMPAVSTLSAFPRMACAQQSDAFRGPYVLSSAQRGAQIRQRVSLGLADKMRSLADAGLGREPHPRAVVHTQEDWRQTLTQALAWCISGDAAYAAEAAMYIDTWVSHYSPSFDPIDEADLIDLLLGFDFVEERLPASTVEKTSQLGRRLATGYLGARHVGDPSTQLNNWQSHRIKLATAGAYLAGDAELIAGAREGFMAHVSLNIGNDGRTYDFNQRDAIHYVVYDLEPLLMAASMAAAHGEDWYGMPSLQGRLPSALQWLEPYAAGDKQHEEFVHSTVRFDARRAAANVKGYAGLWQREESSNLYWIASRLDPEFTRMADALGADPVIRALFA
jgi:Alginate lyase